MLVAKTSRAGDICRIEKTKNKRNAEKKRRPQQDYKGALELARVQNGVGREVQSTLGMARSTLGVESQLLARREGSKKKSLDTTTASGCALGVMFPRKGHLFGRRWRIAATFKRLQDRVSTLSCKGDHQHHDAGSTHVTDTLANTSVSGTCTSREAVFGFIAVAAGTEVAPREREGPAKKKQTCHQDSNQNDPKVSNEASTATADTVQMRHLYDRCEKQPSHSSFDSDEVLSAHLLKTFRINLLTQWRIRNPFLQNGRASRLIKLEQSLSTDSLKHKFSLIKGMSSEGAKMLFPRGTQIYTANTSGLSCVTFSFNCVFATLDNQKECALTVKVRGCQQRLPSSWAGKVSRWSQFLDSNTGRQDLWERQFVVSRPQWQPQHWSMQTREHSTVWHDQCLLPQQRGCQEIRNATARLWKSRIRGTSHRTGGSCR